MSHNAGHFSCRDPMHRIRIVQHPTVLPIINNITNPRKHIVEIDAWAKKTKKWTHITYLCRQPQRRANIVQISYNYAENQRVEQHSKQKSNAVLPRTNAWNPTCMFAAKNTKRNSDENQCMEPHIQHLCSKQNKQNKIKETNHMKLLSSYLAFQGGKKGGRDGWEEGREGGGRGGGRSGKTPSPLTSRPPPPTRRKKLPSTTGPFSYHPSHRAHQAPKTKNQKSQKTRK